MYYLYIQPHVMHTIGTLSRDSCMTLSKTVSHWVYWPYSIDSSSPIGSSSYESENESRWWSPT